ncbi:MAG: hypothetical protein U0350_02485 [Caldilineaceae bacterium]
MITQREQKNNARDICITNFSTSRTLINPDALPRDLLQYRQWVLWQYQPRQGGGKPFKKPINSKTLGPAGPDWPNTWGEFYRVLWAYRQNPDMAGLGFMLTPNDPFVALDLDDCLIDNTLSPFANTIINALPATYWEISPSGQGLRGLVRCNHQPGIVTQPGVIEVYSRKYVTLTGNVLHQNPLAQLNDLDRFIEKFFPETEKPQSTTTKYPDPPADDAELWKRIRAVNHLADQLYKGDLSGVYKRNGQTDRSRAVILLLNPLAKWTKGDAARMRRMMYQTALDKSRWETRSSQGDWLDLAIHSVLNGGKK